MLRIQIADISAPPRMSEQRSPAAHRTSITCALSFNAIAKFLKVSVTENGNQIVQVSMPASQVPELETLMPEDVLEKIQASPTNLKSIIRDSCAAGIIPGELFTLESGPKCYRVWLE